jgi:hypothetical protein
MQPAHLPTSFRGAASFEANSGGSRTAHVAYAVYRFPGGNPAWSCMKNASESKLGPLSADARSNREGCRDAH